MAECPGPILHTVKCQQVGGAVNLYAFFQGKVREQLVYTIIMQLSREERGVFGIVNCSLKSI
jgi:hypothetical protein